MHPIEHVIYFSSVLIFFIIPAHPIHMINLLSRLGVAPAQGHTGFDRVVLGEETAMNTSYYAHYLHHRYFEVNYADGMVPSSTLQPRQQRAEAAASSPRWPRSQDSIEAAAGWQQI